MEEEQRALDDNDDVVSEFHIRIQRLINSATLPNTVSVVVKQLALIEASLGSIEESAHDLDDSDEDNVSSV